MLFRKIAAKIEAYLKQKHHERILIVSGARQVGKTYLIEHLGRQIFPNFVSINFMVDASGKRQFANVRTTEDFYVVLSSIGGTRLHTAEDTLVFLDEIQAYPHFLTLLKFLNLEHKYTYIASGSLLGVTLMQTSSIPIGSIETIEMFPLDFEEFLMANGCGDYALQKMRKSFQQRQPLHDGLHIQMMSSLKKYFLVGGLPAAVNSYLQDNNIAQVRAIQQEVHQYYVADAAKYDQEHRLKIKRVFELIPSALENKKKRIMAQRIENKKGKRFADYQDEFDYLISAGVALEVKSIANPTFPLIASSKKNLLKLYLNDVGILTSILYPDSINAILEDTRSINLGTLYESFVAQELRAHNFKLYYYDNRKNGEVDFLIDDAKNLAVLPIEVKSGKDYSRHLALNHLMQNHDYPAQQAYVFTNQREIQAKGKIYYLPIYNAMFLRPGNNLD